MAVDIDTIGIGADTREIKAATKDLDNFGRSADKASRQADNFGTSTDKAASIASSGMARFATAAGVAFAAFASFSRLTQSADTYTKITAQLRLATTSQEQYNQALSDVSRIATTAQANIDAVSKLYSRLSGSLTELGVTQQKIAGISETVALALKVSGAEAGETASVMLQLSQAFGSGVLRGDEFNSMAENSPILMRALAASLGVTTGALRDMASEGLITREVLLKAFGDEKLLESLRKQAQGIGTVGGSIQVVKNNLIELIGTIDNSTGASAWVRDVFGNLAEYLAAMKLTIESGTWFEKLRFFTIGNLSERLTTQLRNPQGAAMAGNALPGRAAITGGVIGPNFTAPRAVEDINEIHRKQEKAARKAKEMQDKARQERERQLQEEKNLAIQESAFKAKLENDFQEKLKKDFEQRKNDEYERIEKLMDWQQKLANENFKEAQKKVKELNDEAAQIGEILSRSLTDAIFRGFEAGKSFAQNFRDTLINTFRTLVLQPIIRFLVDSSGITKVLAAFGSAFSGSAVAGEGGGILSSLSGGFDSIANIFQRGNASLVSSIESLGTFLSTGTGGLGDTIGGFLGKNAASIADGFGYLGSITQALSGNVTGAALTAIGTYFGGPIGGAIGGLVGSLFGGGRRSTKRFSTGVSGEFANGQFTSRNLSGIAGYGRALGGGDALTEVAKQYSQVVNQLFSAFGEAGSIITNASLFQRSSSKTRAWGYFSAQGGGGSVGISQAAPFASAQAALEDLINRIFTDGITGLVATSNLSAGIKKFFEGLADKDAILDAVVTLTSLNAQLKDLPPVFNALRNALDTTAYTTSIADLKQRFANVQTFTSLFYTEQENFATFTKQITSQFGALNQALPTTRDQYRALVDSINVVDEATSDKFHGLVALAPAMDAYFKRLEQQAEGINQVNEALAQGLDRNLFSTYADFVTAQANASAGLTYTGSIGDLSVRRAQGDAELANAVKSLVAQQARTDQILAEIAESTRRTREINERWNGDGLPETRVI